MELSSVKSLFGLGSIVYVSSAVRILTEEEVGEILEGSRKRNKEFGITGVLLHVDRKFMQYMEGPTASLLSVYDTIKGDSRHTGIIELLRERISERLFNDWSMAYCNRDVSGSKGSAEELKLLESNLENEGAKPNVARIFLHSFWNKETSF